MPTVWDSWNHDHYLGLYPWTWIQMETAEPPGPFPLVAGVDPAVVASLHEAHGLLLSAVETAISDVFAHRSTLDDPAVPGRLEDAYAELVKSRPHLSAHITCRRRPDGTFQWEFPRNPRQLPAMTYAGLQVFNAVNRQAIPFAFNGPIGPAVGRLVGMLDGSRTVGEIRAAMEASGRAATALAQIVELMKKQNSLAVSPSSSLRSHWLATTHDQDVVHLGHAALLYRQAENFFLFDPWLLPWLAESPVPSLWVSLLPRPAA